MSKREAFRSAIEEWYRKNDGENATWARKINDALKRKKSIYEQDLDEPINKQS